MCAMAVSALILLSAALAAPPATTHVSQSLASSAQRSDWGAEAVATASVRILRPVRIGPSEAPPDQSAQARDTQVSGEDGQSYPAIVLDFE